MRKLLALAVLLPACVVPYQGPAGDPYAAPPPPAYAPPPAYPAPPPPAQRRLTRDEAVQAAMSHAARHGFQAVGVREAEREEGRWKVELGLAGGGKARVDVDAWTGAELRFKAAGEGRRRHGEHRGEDRDEDDD